MWHQPRAEFWCLTYAQFMSLIEEHNKANEAHATPTTTNPASEFSLDNVPMGTVADLQKVQDLHP